MTDTTAFFDMVFVQEVSGSIQVVLVGRSSSKGALARLWNGKAMMKPLIGSNKWKKRSRTLPRKHAVDLKLYNGSPLVEKKWELDQTYFLEYGRGSVDGIERLILENNDTYAAYTTMGEFGERMIVKCLHKPIDMLGAGIRWTEVKE